MIVLCHISLRVTHNIKNDLKAGKQQWPLRHDEKTQKRVNLNIRYKYSFREFHAYFLVFAKWIIYKPVIHPGASSAPLKLFVTKLRKRAKKPWIVFVFRLLVGVT